MSVRDMPTQLSFPYEDYALFKDEFTYLSMSQFSFTHAQQQLKALKGFSSMILQS